MLYLLLIGVCILLFSILYRIKTNDYWQKKKVPQVDDLLWTYLFEKRSLAEICKTIYDKYDTPYVGTSMGFTPTLILKNIEDIQAVLAGDFESFFSRGIQTNKNDILADNFLYMSNYKRWKLVRYQMSPMFILLRENFYILEKCARDFVELIEDNEYARQKPFNLLYTYTTGSIDASIFGVDPKSKDSTMDSCFLDMSWKLLKPSLNTKMKVFIANHFPKLFKFFKLKLFEEHEEFFIEVMKSAIEDKKANMRRTYDFIHYGALLQNHLIMQDFYTGYELNPTYAILAAQAFAFFIAGADTTANALHFTLIELSNNKDVLKKIHEEIDSVFGLYKEELSYNDVKKLQYLDMVISETMRMYPPIGIIKRVCTKDTVLPSKVAIEKDTAVVIPIFAIHRDNKYYPDPNVFDPERFRKDTKPNMNFKYLPFGEGNRNCVATKFARLQLKVGLAWLLRRFTLVEQTYTPKFEKNLFALRDPKAHYQLEVRDIFMG